jgi:UDP:flavonoid glycosyltransferase YjiC (YdhE family)
VKVLFCSTGLAGHFNPLVPFINAARSRGDELLVVVPPSIESAVQEVGVNFTLSDPPDPVLSKELWKRAARVSHTQAARLIDGEYFGRLTTDSMVPAVQAACATFRPDVILREPCAYAGAVVGVREGIAHAQVAISTAQTEWSVIDLVAPILEDFEPTMEGAMRAGYYISRFPSSLDPSPFPNTLRYKEDQGREEARGDAPWAAASMPLLYVTLGSITGSLDTAAPAFRRALEAVEGLGVQVLLTTGHGFDRKLLGPLPEDVYVEPWVPQEQVFPHATAVLCHGGSGTTYGALAAALPIVFVPMFADQRTNARLITVAGAGLLVDVGRKSEPGFRTIEVDDVPRIRRAVMEILTQPTFRNGAQRIADEIRDMGSAMDCLAALEERRR